MSRCWRIAVPLLVVAAVFGVGLAFDAAELTWRNWLFFLLFCAALPGVCLAAAVFFLWKGALPHLRHALGDFTQRETVLYSPWDGNKLIGRGPAVVGLLIAFGKGQACLIPFGALFLATNFYHGDGGGLYLPTLWLLSAVAAGLLVAILLHLFRSPRRPVRVAGAVVGIAAVAAVWLLLPVWSGWRERSLYDHFEWRSKDAAEGSEEAQYWADRMVAHRPADWRGYSRRVAARDARGLPPSDLVGDVQTAVALGCDDRHWREYFAGLYARAGRHPDEADEWDAVIRLGLAEAAREGKTITYPDEVSLRRAAFARLHAGEYDAADRLFRAGWSRNSFSQGEDVAEGRALLHLHRGEYPAAIELLLEKKWFTSRTVTRAWLLATCPDPRFFDPDEALKLTEAEILASEWNIARDTDQLTGDQTAAATGQQWVGMTPQPKINSGTLHMFVYKVMNRAKAFVRAAAFTNLGRFEEAEAAFVEATKEGRLGASGFWKPRRDELEACIKARMPYRERPAN